MYIFLSNFTTSVNFRVIKSKARIVKFNVNLLLIKRDFSAPTWIIVRRIREMLEKSKFMLRSLLTVWLLEAAQRCLPCPACAAAGKRPACGWLIFSHPRPGPCLGRGVLWQSKSMKQLCGKSPKIVRAESASSIVPVYSSVYIVSLPMKYIS